MGETRPRFTLTPRQREVLQLVANGKRDAAIAAALEISIFAVQSRLKAIYMALEVPEDRRSPRAYAVATAIRNRLID